MLREKALKAFGKPNLRSRRIFNDEISTIFNLIKSDSSTKFYHGKILFPPFDKYLQDHECFAIDSMVHKQVPCG